MIERLGLKKNYFLSNILLRLFPSIETHLLFLSTTQIPPRSDWTSLATLLLDKSNWSKDRRKLHNKILKTVSSKYKKQSFLVESKVFDIFGVNNVKLPILIIIRGSSGCGKTTFIDKVLGLKSSVIGPDKVREILKGSNFLTGKIDNQYDLESYSVNWWLCEGLLKQKYNLVIERTLEYIDDLKSIINLVIQNNYKTLYFVDIEASLTNCQKRVKERVINGPVVPDNDVANCFYRVQKNRTLLLDYLKNQKKINVIYELYTNTGKKKSFHYKLKKVFRQINLDDKLQG